MSRVTRCDRCNKRYRGHGYWNAIFRQGIVTGFLCPGCQTPEENAAAVINEAVFDYSRGGVDPLGRICAPLKGTAWLGGAQ
jgi:hypothetical protein